MPGALPFKRLDSETSASIELDVEGTRVIAREGDSVAAAMLAAGFAAFRDTPVSATPRGPFCMMGACFDCLVEIDGRANQQACMTRVAEGMHVRRMRGARPVTQESTDGK